MSLRLDATKLEIRDASGGLIVNKATRMIPVVQKVVATNVDVAFPNLSKSVATITRSGYGDAPSGRGWRSYAWGLAVAAGNQGGTINLEAIGAGLAPNLILANVKVSRTASPNQSIFGSFIKAVEENVWLTLRSGMRLEYSAFHRRIAWLEIAGGYLRLRWKQSSRAFSPSYLDPSVIYWPETNYTLKRPPSYQFDSDYREGSDEFPPSTLSTPAGVTDAMNAINFAATWRFQVNAWLMQI